MRWLVRALIFLAATVFFVVFVGPAHHWSYLTTDTAGYRWYLDERSLHRLSPGHYRLALRKSKDGGVEASQAVFDLDSAGRTLAHVGGPPEPFFANSIGEAVRLAVETRASAGVIP